MADSRDEEPGEEFYKKLPVHLWNAGKFLFMSANKLNWEDLSNTIVMDVGCGVSSLKLFSAVFPNFQGVIALDKSSDYIDYSKFYYKHENMDYRVADITDRSTLIEWEGKMSKITSFFCFNCLTDQKLGFANIHYLLQPGGEAVILTALKNPHYECARYLLQKPKWNMYKHLEEKFTDFQAHGTGITFYENILNDLDFEVITCEEEPGLNIFESEEVFRASDLSKDKVIGMHLPTNIRREFEADYFQALLELNGRTSTGEPYLRTSTARIIIRRNKF